MVDYTDKIRQAGKEKEEEEIRELMCERGEKNNDSCMLSVKPSWLDSSNNGSLWTRRNSFLVSWRCVILLAEKKVCLCSESQHNK